MSLILFDVRPDPVPMGIATLVLLVILVLLLTAAAIIVFVFLLKRAKRSKPDAVVGHPAERGAIPGSSQPNSPNQL